MELVDSLPENYIHTRFDASVVNRTDVIELTHNIDNLRPGQTIPTRPVTVVVWSLETADQISVEAIGRAMNRGGDKRFSTSLTVAAHTWSFDQLVKPEAG